MQTILYAIDKFIGMAANCDPRYPGLGIAQTWKIVYFIKFSVNVTYAINENNIVEFIQARGSVQRIHQDHTNSLDASVLLFSEKTNDTDLIIYKKGTNNDNTMRQRSELFDALIFALEHQRPPPLSAKWINCIFSSNFLSSYFYRPSPNTWNLYAIDAFTFAKIACDFISRSFLMWLIDKQTCFVSCKKAEPDVERFIDTFTLIRHTNNFNAVEWASSQMTRKRMCCFLTQTKLLNEELKWTASWTELPIIWGLSFRQMPNFVDIITIKW